jgi:hypothetical protein
MSRGVWSDSPDCPRLMRIEVAAQPTDHPARRPSSTQVLAAASTFTRPLTRAEVEKFGRTPSGYLTPLIALLQA